MPLLIRLISWFLAEPTSHSTDHDADERSTSDRPAGPANEARRCADDWGQATTEYALVMLGAALVALLVVAWATAGGGAGKIGRLFDRVIDAIISKF